MKKKAVISFVIALIILFSSEVAMAAEESIADYSDVPRSHWAYAAIMDMTSRGMFNGTSVAKDGTATFSPDTVMTRAQFITVLTRYLYSTALTELSPGETWYSNNYMLALKNGLLTSDELEGGLLTVACTRQEMAMLLVRAAYEGAGEVAEMLIPASSIPDYDGIADYYRQYVLQAYSMGFLTGVDENGTFLPEGSLNRAQAATAIYRLLDPSARIEVPHESAASYTWRNGIKYSGQIRDGEANGYGKMVFPEIGTYVGNFVNGRREGLGTFTWEVGDTYVGFWNNDKMNGTGTYTFADGQVLRGTWRDNAISAETIYMIPSSVIMTVGATEYVLAKTEPGQITENITWKSSNDTIVSVSGSGNLGTLKANMVGKATISAKTENGKVTTCEVTVKQANLYIRQIQLNYGDYRAKIGDVVQLRAEITPTNAGSGEITWSSSNSAVASVSSNGIVTVKARGLAVISAKAENGLIASCYLTAEDIPYELWNKTWNVYYSTAAGRKTGIATLGTCKLDTGNMTASMTMSPYTGKYVDLKPIGDHMLAGLYETGAFSYELTFTSIQDNMVILEVKRILDGTYYSDTVNVEYYVLEW